MRLGLVVDGSRAFVPDLLADWQANFQVEDFGYKKIDLPIAQGRVNQWRLKRALGDFIRRNDAVFFEWVGPLLAIGSRLQAKTPLVVRLHSWELYGMAARVNWEAVTRVILLSNAMSYKFVGLFPDQANKVRVVHSGKSLTRFQPIPHEFNGKIAMLCNLVPVKRVYDMILTFHELRKSRPSMSLSLHLGGEPAEDADAQRYAVSIRRAIEKLSLQDHVILHGRVDDPASWLQQMDIFVSNSYWEGQQTALLEAMATGCYCLSHFWDGAEEILPSSCLYASDTELMQKILSYCEQPEAIKCSYRTAMRDIACKSFDARRMQNEIRTVILDAAQGRTTVRSSRP